MLFLPRNDPLHAAIAKRARAVLARQPGHCVEEVAETLTLPRERLRQFLGEPARHVDASFLIDVVVALVHECGVDPKWLLTGEYDGMLHRQALLLGEDRTLEGTRAVRELVEAEYRKLPRSRILPFLPVTHAAS